MPDGSCAASQTDPDICLLELKHFKQLIQRDGFGAIYWNENDSGAFVTAEVIDNDLETDLARAGSSANTIPQ